MKSFKQNWYRRFLITLSVIVYVPFFCQAQSSPKPIVTFKQSGYFVTLATSVIRPYDSIPTSISLKISGKVFDQRFSPYQDSMEISLTDQKGTQSNTQIQKDGFYELLFPLPVKSNINSDFTLAFSSSKFPVEKINLKMENGMIQILTANPGDSLYYPKDTRYYPPFQMEKRILIEPKLPKKLPSIWHRLKQKVLHFKKDSE